MNAFCISNQLSKDWFERAVKEATDIAIDEFKSDGLSGKSIDPAYVRSLVLETILSVAAVAGEA
jgi:hypothetical protein